MNPFDDDDRDGADSANGSSDNDQDETMQDIDDGGVDDDADAEPEEQEAEVEAEDEENEENEENEGDEDSPSQSLPQSRVMSRTTTVLGQSGLRQSISDNSQDNTTLSQQSQAGPTSAPNPTVLLTSPSPHRASTTPVLRTSSWPSPLPQTITAPIYDIAPTIAAPHSTSINSITATPDMRWVFSGGADGYIRKFNWVDTANGKVMLTVAQRHPFVDSVTKAGVLMSYWENEEAPIKSPSLKPAEDGPNLSPVYSLAVERSGLWLLSGLESGCINLQSVRHDEGKLIHSLRKHTSAVSALNLAHDQKSVLSGSWDKFIFDWDLNLGVVRRTFAGSGGQISALEMRPTSTLAVPEESGELPLANGTLSSNNAFAPKANGILTNGVADDPMKTEENGEDDHDSLFDEDEDALFGEPLSTQHNTTFDDDDDGFSRPMTNGLTHNQVDADAEGDITMENSEQQLHQEQAAQQPPEDEELPEGGEVQPPAVVNADNSSPDAKPTILANGLPHAEELQRNNSYSNGVVENGAPPPEKEESESTFLAASFDGTIRVWDRRQPNPVATILPRNAPPWCMSACWSPDGNVLYAGRRNGTVEEYSLHKGLREPERTFKFPNGSGPVSAVKSMPNSRHLVCASSDILRLYDLKEQAAFKHAAVPFLIIPGHRGGVIASLYLDPACRYLISASGNRGWEGTTTEVLLGYEISVGN